MWSLGQEVENQLHDLCQWHRQCHCGQPTLPTRLNGTDGRFTDGCPMYTDYTYLRRRIGLQYFISKLVDEATGMPFS